MIVPKKSLGQNFLSDENVARNIAESLNLHPGEVLLEIGAGTGALTKHLVGRVDDFIVVEIDRRAAEVLKERFGDQCEVRQEDVLGIDAGKIVRDRGKPLRVVGNIPYYITSEILFWIFDQRSSISDATLMMQLEVGRRLVAARKTKDYGILSIFTQFYSTPELVTKVSRNSFYPKPNVDSALLRLTLKKDLPPHDDRLFRTIVRGTFGKRRKTLHNGLRYLGFSDDQLSGVGVDLQKRPEELGSEEFLVLTKRLKGKTPGAKS